MSSKPYILENTFLYLYPIKWKSFITVVTNIHEGMIDSRTMITTVMVPDLDNFIELCLAQAVIYMYTNFYHIYQSTVRAIVPNLIAFGKLKSVMEVMKIPVVVLNYIREMFRPMTLGEKVYYPDPYGWQLYRPNIVNNTPMVASQNAYGTVGAPMPLVPTLYFRPPVMYQLLSALNHEYPLEQMAVESLESQPLFCCNSASFACYVAKELDPVRLKYCITLEVCDIQLRAPNRWLYDNLFKARINVDYTSVLLDLSLPIIYSDLRVFYLYQLKTDVAVLSKAQSQTRSVSKPKPPRVTVPQPIEPEPPPDETTERTSSGRRPNGRGRGRGRRGR